MEFFENAALYSEFSNLQKKDAQSLFKEFVNKNKDRLEKCKEILDIGCGTGEAFFDFMLPCLKVEFTKVTGIDVSQEMIKFAIKKYGKRTNNFHVFDIQSGLENIHDSNKLGRFDLVTSSYCYQWVKDEKAALWNIYSLLKPNGFCFMIFPVNHVFYKACVKMAKVEKFKPFVKLEDFITHHFYRKNPVKDLKNNLNDVGFNVKHLELRRLNFTFPSMKHLENTFKAVIPFKMPEELKNKFATESARAMVAMDDLNHVTDDGGLNFSYELMIVVVSK